LASLLHFISVSFTLHLSSTITLGSKKDRTNPIAFLMKGLNLSLRKGTAELGRTDYFPSEDNYL
jgi:hypothetical protein